MKKILFLFSLLLVSFALFAQIPDYLSKKEFQSEKMKISERISGIKKSLSAQTGIQDSLIKSLVLIRTVNENLIDSVKRQSNVIKELSASTLKYQAKTDTFNMYFYLALLISLGLFLILYFYFRADFRKLRTRFAEDNSDLKKEIEAKITSLKEIMSNQEDVLENRISGIKTVIQGLEIQFSENKSENETNYRTLENKVQDQFGELKIAAEKIGKKHQDEIRSMEDQLQKKWAIMDAKLTAITAKLPEL